MINQHEKLSYLNEHISYEVIMLNYTFMRLMTFRSATSEEELDRNAFLESFGIHARNLVEFFTKKMREDDRTASDYMPAFEAPNQDDGAWARDPKLCDGPLAAGAGFNDSLEEGQIALPPATRCKLDGRTISKLEVKVLSALTDDTQVALSALFARLVESPGHPVATTRVLALERTIIAVRFGGSRSRYLSALRARGASLTVARAVIADQLRRQDIAARRDVQPAFVGRDLPLPQPLRCAAGQAGASRQHRVVARRQATRIRARSAGTASAADASDRADCRRS